MSIQEFLKLWICEELLTQQYAGASATGEKVDENLFIFGLGFSEGLIERTLEPVLAKG